MRTLACLFWLLLVAAPAAQAGHCAQDEIEVNGECIKWQSGEVIDVVPAAVCAPDEVEYDGWCYSIDYYDRLCFYNSCSGMAPPPGTPGRPLETAQPSTPPPTTTTKEQCQAALDECQTKALTEGIENCEARWARTAMIQAAKGDTCFGDPSQVWDNLYVNAADPDKPYRFGDGKKKCYKSDFGFGQYGTDKGSRYKRACTEKFFMEAITQCVRGRDPEERGSPFYFEVPFKIVTIGLQADAKVNLPPGVGFRERCTTAGLSVVEGACVGRHTQCMEKVQGGTPKVQGGTATKVQGGTATKVQGGTPMLLDGTRLVVVVPSAMEELLDRVDEERLGLESKGTNTGRPTALDRPEPAAGYQTTRFRPIRQQPDENEQTYRARLDFLGDWSEFIERTGLRGEPQRLVELGLLDAQQGFTRADEEWIALLTRVWVPSLDAQRQLWP